MPYAGDRRRRTEPGRYALRAGAPPGVRTAGATACAGPTRHAALPEPAAHRLTAPHRHPRPTAGD
ncbi:MULTISPECIES: hypothetical protein [unclassified Streptomyces]|uniref:hypothetical protein n=1 Tax=unclassified Streptomyces TaxID=2593676 RepID=UPI0004C0ED57|nr:MULTISPECIES: hypothetical protein [unclassified Streptomyces]